MTAKNLILLISAFMATGAVSAQLSFASQKNISFAVNNESAANTRNYYATPDGTYQHSATPVAFFASPAGRNGSEGEKTGYSNKRNIRTSFLPAENKNKVNTEKLEISFRSTSFTYPKNCRADIGIAQYSKTQLILYAKLLKQYAKKNGFDTAYAFLSNMGMLSNKKRFFVINLVTLEIEQAGLVSHGRGQGHSVYDKQYSNKAGSNSTSLGRYKISGKYRGGYGEAYKMVGLDSSNRNAYNRNIVLHTMGCIPDMEGFMPACVSEGCPAVSTKFFSFLRQIIDSRKKPVLLWIFDSNLEELVEDSPERNSLAATYEQNKYKSNPAFKIFPEFTFQKEDNVYKRRAKYTASAFRSKIYSDEQNHIISNEAFFTIRPRYIPERLNAAVFPYQNQIQELVNTKPASARALSLPVDIAYVLTKRKKN